MWTDRTEILTGKEGLARLAASRVMVVGLGGVGAVAAEMVARAGVGSITILDSDTVSETNINRQIIALHSTIGKDKTTVVAERLLDINPELKLTVVKTYLTENNIPDILEKFLSTAPGAGDSGLSEDGNERTSTGKAFVIDAIDTLAPKLALIKYCVENGIALVSSMGSGAKYDLTRIRIADLSKSFNCPLAYIVRKKLRKMGISRGFKVVFSEELPDENAIVEMTAEEMAEVSNKKSQVGTISYMPAVFGCVCAQAVISRIAGLTENC